MTRELRARGRVNARLVKNGALLYDGTHQIDAAFAESDLLLCCCFCTVEIVPAERQRQPGGGKLTLNRWAHLILVTSCSSFGLGASKP